jgi:hypothetical protein
MVEILWKTDDPHAKLQEREFFELRLVDFGLNRKPRFLIREIHAAWSDSEERIKWDGYREYVCCTPEEAQQHFAARKAAIVAKGFNRSSS